MDTVQALTILAAFLTSALSAVVGMAGGINLLAVMMMLLDYSLIIPLHGITQLVSNSSRAWFFRKGVDFSIFWQFGLTLIPASFLGLMLIGQVSVPLLKAATAIFILYALFSPGLSFLKHIHGSARFRVAGFLSGCVGMVVGATGPLISPFFLHSGLAKNALIGTQAACQIFQHGTKVLLFGAVLDFPYQNHIPLAIGMCLAAILGTWSGKNVLAARISEAAFKSLYRNALGLIALKILLWDVLYKSYFSMA